MGTLFKNDYIDKKSNTTYIQNDKKEKIHTKITNTPDAKISVKRQSAGINYRYGSSWKKKDLIQCIICDEQKHKKGHPIALAKKTCDVVLNSMSKITILNILMVLIEFFFC